MPRWAELRGIQYRDVTRIDEAEGQAIGKYNMRARSARRQTQNLINIHEMTSFRHFDSLKSHSKDGALRICAYAVLLSVY